MELSEQVQNLLSHCENYATDLLMETGEFFPFGALTDSKGRTHHREVEVDLKNIPSNGEIIDDIEDYFLFEVEKYDARGYALAYEAKVQIDENTSTDAIAINIKFKKEPEVPLFYIPYSFSEDDGHVLFGEMFAVKRL
ncbi:MAG: hypothetical protein K9H16_08255 [Bacteroidales bacterium]|nr:hypothetical protein [Bacteroidales bacterium]